MTRLMLPLALATSLALAAPVQAQTAQKPAAANHLVAVAGF